MTDKEKVTAAIDLIDTLDHEELNEVIDYIRSTIKVRAANRNAKARATLQIGSRVRLPKSKPQYLTGLTGEVTEKRNTRVVVKLDCGPIGKFTSGNVVTSPGMLEVL